MRLHGYFDSINVRKVLWLAAELDLPIELIERGTLAKPASDARYRTLNPFGMVPCLEDAGLAVAESNTILRYLARREGRKDLLPDDAAAAARVDTWLDWQVTDLNDSWRYAFMARFRDKPGYHDPARVESSLATFDAKIAMIDARLSQTGAFVSGATFTLADIVIGLSIRRWHAFEPETARYESVATYYNRLCERPAFSAFGGPDSPL
jgi:glutathione S-transferase